MAIKILKTGARYLIRLDDIAPNMNWEAYFRAKALFQKYDVKPLIGVIPDNQDPCLLAFPTRAGNFWDEVRSVQADGWAIALHGYQHIYDSGGDNYLGFKGPSEFANHPEEVQYEKLKKGLEVFRDQNVRSDAFFAPSHAFDRNTIRALKRLGIDAISDGYNLYPYKRDGMLFVPQMIGRPMVFPFGVHTSVHHLNHFKEPDFVLLERFLSKNYRRVITFQEAKTLRNDGWFYDRVGRCVQGLLRVKRRLLSASAA